MRSFRLKGIMAAAVALILSVSVFGGSGVMTLASDFDEPAEQTESTAQGEGAVDKTEVKDMDSYRERLSEIAKEQKELDEQLKEAQDSIEEQAKIQTNITKRINS